MLIENTFVQLHTVFDQYFTSIISNQSDLLDSYHSKFGIDF